MKLADVDLYDPDNYVERFPHDMLAVLRREAPIYFHDDPQGPGFWALTKYDDVVHVSRHPELFSSYRETALLAEHDDEAKSQQRLMMLNMDPPEHTRLRKIVNRGFTPRMIKALQPRLVELCDEIFDRLEGKTEFDFVTEVAAELPLETIAELMGAPLEDRGKIFAWSNQMIGFDDPEFQTSHEDAQEAAMGIMAYGHELGERRRANPTDDIVSKLVTAELDGGSLDELQFGMFFILLSVAGNETTRNTISGGMQAFFDHPDQWEKLKCNPELVPSAVEEVLRWVTPVIHFRRTATTDTEIRGQRIAEGEKVVVYYASANRDEDVFDKPDTFDITRRPNPHIAFGGGGPHFCLGAHLAQAQLRTMFSNLIERMPDISPAGPARRLRSNFINGIKEMPVRVGVG